MKDTGREVLRKVTYDKAPNESGNYLGAMLRSEAWHEEAT